MSGGHNDMRHIGREIQRDPYPYLLNQSEKQSARNVPFRVMFNGAAVGAAALYFITRHNELHRLRNLSVSLDLVFGLGWRMAFAGLAADQASRRLFVNQRKLREHKIAENEVRKIFAQVPNSKILLPRYKKTNSFYLA